MSTAIRQTVSVVLTTENAADMLADCLRSVSWADEILVIDQFSTDDTAALCASYPQCRRIEHRERYLNAAMNFGFEHATGDWIMRIDTDERVTPELAREVQGILSSPPAGVSGYAFWERPVMLGHELRHGYGQRHHRMMMWRRGAARYPVDTSHEELRITGVCQKTVHGYIHLNNPTVGTYLRKTDFWTERDAERADLATSPPGAGRTVIDMARAFYLYYLKLRGYRDGYVGFVDATMRAAYPFVFWAKLRHRWERERGVVDT